MPSKTTKQLNYFQLVKSYKNGGYKAFFSKWKEIFGNRPFPETSYINKIIKTSSTIKNSDLDDMASGIVGDETIGDLKEIKVGYWTLFKGSYRDSITKEPKEGTFVAQIKKVDNMNKIANFNINDIRNKFGVKILPLKRATITHPEFMYLDYSLFKNIIKTGKLMNDVIEQRDGNVKEMFGDYKFGDYESIMSEIRFQIIDVFK